MPDLDDRDDDLRACLARGELAEARQLLMRRYGNDVYRYCRLELRDPVLADDVHQRVFIEATRDLETLRRGSAVRGWLFAIARHRVLDAAKARRRAHAWIDEVDPTEMPDLRPPPDEALDEAQLHEALHACMAELDDKLREVLLLRFQQGLTYEEMEEVCGEKAGTLHARVTRAMPVLRARIERWLRRGLPEARRRSA